MRGTAPCNGTRAAPLVLLLPTDTRDRESHAESANLSARTELLVLKAGDSACSPCATCTTHATHRRIAR